MLTASVFHFVVSVMDSRSESVCHGQSLRKCFVMNSRSESVLLWTVAPKVFCYGQSLRKCFVMDSRSESVLSWTVAPKVLVMDSRSESFNPVTLEPLNPLTL